MPCKFKVGNKIKCKPGGIQAWVYSGNVYEVISTIKKPAEAGSSCYRSCEHPMHNPKPEKYYVVIKGKFGNLCAISEECFDLVIPNKKGRNGNVRN